MYNQQGETPSETDSAFLNTLSNGLKAVEALVDGRRTLRELAEILGLSRQTTYRIIRTLNVMGWTERRESDDTYGLSTRLWSIGVRSHGSTDLREKWSYTVRKLSVDTGETVHLAVYDQGWSVYIAKHDGSYPISSYTRLGGRSPAYCVATGKVLLAAQPADEIEKVLAADLTKFSDKTITDPSELRKELGLIREKGYAVNDGEYRTEVGGIAIPIYSPLGDLIAAIGFSGPADRIRVKSDELLRALNESIPGA